jgi:hypothetical protein
MPISPLYLLLLSVLMKTLEEQFCALQEVFPSATMTPVDGVHLVNIPSVELPTGWSSSSTSICFIVPHGYPYAPPDCFWADKDLKIAPEHPPQNAQIGYVVPGQPNPSTLWFSWHVQAWKPASCDLLTYVKIIRNRFEERR